MSKHDLILIPQDPNLRKCSHCKQYKQKKDFYSNVRSADKLCSRCKACDKKTATEWWKNNPERKKISRKKWADKNPEKVRKSIRKIYLRKKFGITTEQYEEMVVKQNFTCLICKKHQSELEKSLSIDHCHKTGIIRGLLCNACNRGIGNLGDDLETLKNAVKYLEKFK